MSRSGGALIYVSCPFGVVCWIRSSFCHCKQFVGTSKLKHIKWCINLIIGICTWHDSNEHLCNFAPAYDVLCALCLRLAWAWVYDSLLCIHMHLEELPINPRQNWSSIRWHIFCKYMRPWACTAKCGSNVGRQNYNMNGQRNNGRQKKVSWVGETTYLNSARPKFNFDYPQPSTMSCLVWWISDFLVCTSISLVSPNAHFHGLLQWIIKIWLQITWLHYIRRDSWKLRRRMHFFSSNPIYSLHCRFWSHCNLLDVALVSSSALITLWSKVSGRNRSLQTLMEPNWVVIEQSSRSYSSMGQSHDTLKFQISLLDRISKDEWEIRGAKGTKS